MNEILWEGDPMVGSQSSYQILQHYLLIVVPILSDGGDLSTFRYFVGTADDGEICPLEECGSRDEAKRVAREWNRLERESLS